MIEKQHPGIINFLTNPESVTGNGGIASNSVVGAELILWWKDVEPEEGRYTWEKIEQAADLWAAQGKKLDIRLSTAHNGPSYTPNWLFDDHKIRRVARGNRSDFTDGAGDYRLGKAGRVSAAPKDRISGFPVCRVDVTASAGIVEALSFGDAYPLDPDTDYAVQFSYRASGQVRGWVSLECPGSPPLDFAFCGAGASERTETGGGKLGSFFFRSGSSKGQRLVWRCQGRGRVCLTELMVMKHVVRPEDVPVMVEEDDRRCRLVGTAKRTRRRGLSMEGSGRGRYTPLVRTDPRAYPVRLGEIVTLGVHFHVLDPLTLVMRVLNARTGQVRTHRRLSVKRGQRGVFRHQEPVGARDPSSVVEFGVEGSGRIHFGNVTLQRWTDRVTCFPDYFDPAFRRKWEELVVRFGARYDKDPRIGCISVGGFGRWEEVILDLHEDYHGSLNDQWLARGFTPERYLGQIEWCMDLFRRAFPAKPLRVCLAYGAYTLVDEHWTYRQVANAAAKRGIGLKQNGMSERYDSWNDNTNPSYIFNRFRDDPRVNLTYETAGQICWNHYDATGHPVSLLNRVLIDGADNLFLYGVDLLTPYVGRYLHYAAEQMGTALFTVFYNRLGAFSLLNGLRPQPMVYKNQWLGLRQAHDVPASHVVVAGEPCAETAGPDNCIVFDLDDRQQHNGLHGAALAVRFFDAGDASFRVEYRDGNSNRRRSVGRVDLEGTLCWRTRWFWIGGALNSPRHRGMDVQDDIRIVADPGAVVRVAWVELHHVPARNWETCVLAESRPVRGAKFLSRKVSREITIPSPGAPAAFISVPLSVESMEEVTVTVVVRGGIGSKWQEVGRREGYYPADGSWLSVPLSGAVEMRRFRIEATATRGNVGWCLGADGDPGFRVESYAMDWSPAAQFAPVDGKPSQMDFHAEAPFAGLNVDGGATRPSRMRLLRVTSDAPAAWAVAERVPDSAAGWFAFDPLPAGHYRLLMDGDATPGLAPVLRVGRLQRRSVELPPKPDPSPGRPVRSWQFSSDNPHFSGWAMTGASGTPAAALVESPMPRLCSPPFAAIGARTNHHIGFRMRNQTGSPMVRLFWTAKPGRFELRNSVLIPVVPNDRELREYSYPVGTEGAWRGKVCQFMLEPVTGGTDAGRFGFTEFSLVEADLLRRLRFDHPLDQFEIAGGTGTVVQGKGALTVGFAAGQTVTAVSAEQVVLVRADTRQKVVFRLRNRAGLKRGVLKWRHMEHLSPNTLEWFAGQRDLAVEFRLAADTGAFREYTVDVSAHAGWKGIIHRLGFEFAGGRAEGTVEIRDLKILNGTTR